ncbi:unnamed protein product [Symbiodinium natans]|uniref:Uncharacterized protein n=1 Tax=Symbiodinium natans TaxID=878477 RepID=A0A812SFQ8_9DINO|nr:unnamed protein product [Symbiodinium natans]
MASAAAKSVRCSENFIAIGELCGGLCIFVGLAPVIMLAIHGIHSWAVGQDDFEVANMRSFSLHPLRATCRYEVYTEESDCARAGLQEVSAETGVPLLQCSSCRTTEVCQRHADWEDVHKPPLRLVAYITLHGRDSRSFNVVAAGAWVLDSCRVGQSWVWHAQILALGIFCTCLGCLLCHLTRPAPFRTSGSLRRNRRNSPDVPDGEWYDYDMVQVVFEQMLELKKLQMQCEDKEINEQVSEDEGEDKSGPPSPQLQRHSGRMCD